MANPKLFNTEGVGATKQSDHFLRIAIGATGAVGAITVTSPVFAQVPLTRTGVGAYTFNLREPWALLCGFSAYTEQATVAATDGTYGQLISSANINSAATPGFTFQMQKSDGTGAVGEIHNPAILYVWLALKNNVLIP